MKYPTIRELEQMPPEQVDEVVKEALLKFVDMNTPEGKTQAQARALWVTSLREHWLWPPHYREGR